MRKSESIITACIHYLNQNPNEESRRAIEVRSTQPPPPPLKICIFNDDRKTLCAHEWGIFFKFLVAMKSFNHLPTACNLLVSMLDIFVIVIQQMACLASELLIEMRGHEIVNSRWLQKLELELQFGIFSIPCFYYI